MRDVCGCLCEIQIKKIKYRPIVGRGCLLIFLFSGPSLFLLGFLEIRVLFLSGGRTVGLLGERALCKDVSTGIRKNGLICASVKQPWTG